jgi:hypothetical protein
MGSCLEADLKWAGGTDSVCPPPLGFVLLYPLFSAILAHLFRQQVGLYLPGESGRILGPGEIGLGAQGSLSCLWGLRERDATLCPHL